MAKQVFYDPQRKRWGRLRRLFDVLGLVVTGLVFFFIVSIVFSTEPLPRLLLPEQKRKLHAVKEPARRLKTKAKGTHRKTQTPASEIELNNDEGVRAAYYVQWDAASFVSLREYYPQLDILFPEWLHVLTPDGNMKGVDEANHLFPVIQDGKIHPVDAKVMPFLKAENAEVEVFPLVNNFDPVGRQWLTNVGDFLNNAPGRANFRAQLLQFLASDRYQGATLDFEEIPVSAQPGFRALVDELGQELHARGLKLYVNVPVSDNDYDYGRLAASADGLVIMNYDEHQVTSGPGPVASQDWFVDNLRQALKDIPKNKIICAIGNYGYEWTMSANGKRVVSVAVDNVQDAWLHARESDAEVVLHPDSLNPHYAYTDEGVEHQVWFLDAVTTLNQMRAARDLGIRTFALWRLGSEDRSLWAIWDSPSEKGAAQKLKAVPAGADVDREGFGDVLYVEHQPRAGEREVTVDPETHLVDAEKMTVLPEPYQLNQYGAKEKQIAITFDDGPDPSYTPRILDILKQKQATATFFLIGMQAQQFPGLAKRIYREGHGIGNHTLTHPDISEVSQRYMRLELNVTERLFASKLGVKPLFFRCRPMRLTRSQTYLTRCVPLSRCRTWATSRWDPRLIPMTGRTGAQRSRLCRR